MTQDRRQNKKLLLISAGLVIATFIAYEPVRHNGFVGYDDDGYVTKNTDVQKGLTQESIIWAFTTSHTGYPHPFTWLSHMLDSEIYGLNAPGHHISSLLIHTVNALLLFWILIRLTGSTWPSAFVAAAFALHPLQVESVAWVSERKTVLAGFFWMLTILAYVHYVNKPNIKTYLLLILAFAMGLMSKPMVVTLPLVLMLLDYWPLGRYENFKSLFYKLFYEKIPLFVLSVIWSVITAIAQREAGTMSSLTNVSLDSRLSNVFVSYVMYIYKLIWPRGLAVFYPHYKLSSGDATVIFSGLIFVVITILCLYLGRKKNYFTTGWLWFVGTLVPMIGLVQVGAQAMANRYMYISMLGLLIIIAWSVKEIIKDKRGLKFVAAILASGILAAAIILTRMQVKYWENDLALFGYAMEVTEKNYIAESNYGMALLNKQRFKEAETHIRNAILINPKFDEAYSNLGTVYIQMGRNDEAVKYFQKAIELKSDNCKTLNNYAWLLATQKEVSDEDTAKSIELASRACELTENKDAEFLDTLAVAYASGGRFADAIKISNQAVNIAKVTGQDNLVDEIQSRIKLYRAGQRYQMK